jgi:hypothetical protein
LDFTFSKYEELIHALLNNQYAFYTFEHTVDNQNLQRPYVILRHDVDRMPARALNLAKLEYELGVVSTYFFRIKPLSFNKDIITHIKKQGHEIGYHYEELCDTKGDFERAWQLFKMNIKRFEEVGAVKSIAMHGRPFTQWDNRDLWNHYDYKEVGILMEAYRDIDWNDCLYFSDVGRCWNSKNNVRDKIKSSQQNNVEVFPSNTDDLIHYINRGRMNLVISTHPERWSHNTLEWLQVFVTDRSINVLKRVMTLIR